MCEPAELFFFCAKASRWGDQFGIDAPARVPHQMRGLSQEAAILDQISTTTGIPLVAVIALILFVLAVVRYLRTKRQRTAAATLRSAFVDAAAFILLSVAISLIFVFVGRSPYLSELQEIAEITSGIAIYAGIAGAVARLVEHGRQESRTEEDRVQSRLSRAVFYGSFIALGAGVYVLVNGYTPTEFYLWTGATAAVLAFIMQQTLGDLFSGLALSLERPFRIGDWLRLPDGTEGQVQDINWRATHLRGWDNTTFVIPNSVLARESFTNLHGARHKYAPWYTLQVSGEADPKQIITLMQEAVTRCPTVLSAPAPVVRLMNGSRSPYIYMVWVHFANYPSMFAGREEIYREVDAALRQEGLKIAADMQEISYTRSDPSTPAG